MAWTLTNQRRFRVVLRQLREAKEQDGAHSTTRGVRLRLDAEAAAAQDLEDHQVAAEVEERPQGAEDHLILGDQDPEGRLAVEEAEAHLQEAADRQIRGRES